MQQNKFRLCGDRDKMINHIISERSKLAQKEYKTRHDWVGKVIHKEVSKKLKFDHTTKQYMHKPDSVLDNQMRKILWDFEIQSSWRLQSRATQRLPFQQLLHQGVGEGTTPFLGLLQFTLDMYLIFLSVKQGDIKYHF